MESNTGRETWSSVAGRRKVQTQSMDRERTFHELQDMFKGQVDADVVHMVLQENDWKVDDAVEQLLTLSSNANTSSRPGKLTMKSVAKTMNSAPQPSNPGQQTSLHIDLKSRLPSVSSQTEARSDGGALMVLSPRTPGTASTGDVNFPSFPQDQNVDANYRTALNALDSYANSSYNYGTAFNSGTPTNYGVWDFDMAGNSAAASNVPPPPLNENSVGNYSDAPPNPFSSLPGLNNFAIPTSSSSTPVTESSQLFTTSSTSSLVKPSSPRTNHNGMYSEGSFNSPHRLSSVSSGLTSPFPMLSSGAPEFSAAANNTVQTPSRQSSSGSNEGPVQPLPASSSETTAQRFRKYNMSLNATERESLEKLIEEVIIGGVDQGFVDSEATSSEDDESSDTKKVKKDSDSSGKEAGKPKEGKLYGSQMKVAAKHMKNLPPRFARRIQAAQKHADANLAALDKKVTSPEDEKRPKLKKKTGGLLEGIDSYFDEDEGPVEQLSPIAGQDSSISELFDNQPTPDALQNLMLGELSSLATPPLVPSPKLDSSQDLNRTPTSQIASQPGSAQKNNSVLGCEELDRELVPPGRQSRENLASQFPEPPAVPRLAGTQLGEVPPHIAHSEQYLALSEADRHKLSGFSVNAPEFVPRSVTPTKFSASQAQILHVTPPPPPPPPPPRPVVLQQTAASVSTVPASMPHPQVTLLDSRQVMAPVVSQAFTQPPPPPTKVAVNRGGQFHAPLGRMSPQLIPHVAAAAAAQGRHSPTPAFILPKQPSASATSSQGAAVAAQAAAALQAGHPAVPGMIQYAQAPYAVAFPTPPPPPGQPPPAARYAAAYAYARPPFIPPAAAYPATWAEKPPPTADKLQGRIPAHKLTTQEKMWVQANSQVYTSMALPVSTQSARLATTYQPNTVLNRGAMLKPEPLKQPHSQPSVSKEGAALLAAAGSPLQQQLGAEKPAQKVYRLVQEGFLVMVILRGLPGSGKSALAKEIKQVQEGGIILTTDDYFIAMNMQYKFDYSRLGEAHEFNQKRAKLAVDSKVNPIIIDNTNTQQWEMAYYITLAKNAKYHIEIFEPDTAWKFKPKECFKKGTHNVTLEHIQRMSDRYEHNVTVDSILKAAEKTKEAAGEGRPQEKQQQQQQQQQQPQQVADAGQSEKAEEPTAQPHKKSTRKRKRRKKKKNKEQKDTGGEKVEGKDEKEGVSSDEDDSTPDREQQAQKQILKREAGSALPTVEESKPTADEPTVPEKPTEESRSSVPVIENTTASHTTAQETDVAKEHLSEAIDVINNNSCKKDTEKSSPGPDNTENTREEKETEPTEEAPDQKHQEDKDENTEHVTETEVAEAETAERDDNASSSESDVDAGTGDVKCEAEQDADSRRPDDGMSGAASEEDNAVSGTDSGDVGTPLQRRLSEVHLGQPDVLKSILAATLKEIDSICSTGSESDTPEERRMLLRRKLHERRVSDTLIAEIEEIFDRKTNAAPDNPTEEAMAGAALEENVEAATNPSEKAYWTQEDAEDRYAVSIDSSDVVPTPELWTGEGDKAWEAAPSPTKEEAAHSSAPTDCEPRTQRQPRAQAPRHQAAEQHTPAPASESNGDAQGPSASEGVGSVPKDAESVPAETAQLQVEMTSASTYTDPRDFSKIQRLLHDAEAGALLTGQEQEQGGFRAVLDARPREICDHELVQPAPRRASTVLTRDQSSMAEEKVRKSPDDLTFLHSCFPTVDLQSLADVLAHCDGDIQWATNILLDSSLEYNEPGGGAGTQQDGDHNYAAVDPLHMAQESGPVEEKLECPPPLLALAFNAVPEAQKETLFCDDFLRDFVDCGVRGNMSVTEFREQHGWATVDDDPSFDPWNALDDDDIVAMLESDHRREELEEEEAAEEEEEEEEAAEEQMITAALFLPTVEEEDEEEDEEEARLDALIEQELWEVSTEEELVLDLPAPLAQQLVRLFGPVGFHISSESFDAEELKVSLNRSLAKEIHAKWSSCLRTHLIRQQEQLQQDLLMARKQRRRGKKAPSRPLQPHATAQVKPLSATAAAAAASPSVTPPRKVSSSGASSPRPGSPWQAPASPSASFREIIEEQHAQERSQANANAKRAVDKWRETSVQRMKLAHLQNTFPDLARDSLDELLQSSDYNVESVYQTVKVSVGATPRKKQSLTPAVVQQLEERMQRLSPTQLNQPSSVSSRRGRAQDRFSYCLKASEHGKRSRSALAHADGFKRSGQQIMSEFYLTVADHHAAEMKVASTNASRLDLRESNAILDLHGYTKTAGMERLGKFLHDAKERAASSKGRPTARVITGKGNHSPDRIPVLKVATLQYLERHRFKYEIPKENSGMVIVDLKS